jgi:hypothetical protein
MHAGNSTLLDMFSHTQETTTYTRLLWAPMLGVWTFFIVDSSVNYGGSKSNYVFCFGLEEVYFLHFFVNACGGGVTTVSW